MFFTGDERMSSISGGVFFPLLFPFPILVPRLLSAFHKVETCLTAGLKVQMQYEPGKVRVSSFQDAGGRCVLICSWDKEG